jgi:putative protease
MSDCSQKSIEILSPAGSREAFIAAVENGADAVYLGGKLFNARHFAKNFELDEIKELTRYAHLNQVKVFITLNILIDQQEFPAVFDYVKELLKADVDAIVVQDIGLASVLRRLLPESLEIHASTQMSIMNSPGVRFAEDLGISQVVLAREVSLEDVREIRKKSKAAIEVFCHGALCTAYSGQCLMSSMMGGRSGNRGQCAQPCRMKYRLLDSAMRPLGDAGEYLLSTKDLCAIDLVDQFAEAGVKTLKIEGRMKRPEYVAIVTGQYCGQRDHLPLHGESRRHILTRSFNRGFTDGYYLQKPGPHLMSRLRTDNQGIRAGVVLGADLIRQAIRIQVQEPISIGDGIEIIQNQKNLLGGEVKSLYSGGKALDTVFSGTAEMILGDRKPKECLQALVKQKAELYKTYDSILAQEARSTYAKIGGRRRRTITLRLQAKVGQPLILQGWDELGNEAEIRSSSPCQQAISQPSSPEQLRQQLDRFGGSLFAVGEIEIDADPQVMVPASQLNQLRRQWAEMMEAKCLEPYRKAYPVSEDFDSRLAQIKAMRVSVSEPADEMSLNGRKTPCLTIRVGDMAGLKAALSSGIREIYFGGEAFRGSKGISDQKEINRAAALCQRYAAKGYYVLPRFVHEHQISRLEKHTLWAKEAGVFGFAVSNPGAWQLCRDLGMDNLTVDWPMNIFNDFSARLMEGMGAERLCLSPELTLEQIKQISVKNIQLEAVIHGRLPLMILEHCLPGSLTAGAGNKTACSQPCLKEHYVLEDRMRFRFPVEQDTDCRNWIFNAKTHSMLEHVPKLLSTELSHWRIEARTETADWIERVAEAYRACLEAAGTLQLKEVARHFRGRLNEVTPQGFTTGHYFRGVHDFS